MKRSAFTMVEVLVAIGIIVLLVGMLIIGGKYVFGASQARDTTVAFETLKSLENEMKLAAVSSPATWVWSDVPEVDPRQPSPHFNLGLDFWKVPWRGNSSAVPAATDPPSRLHAPGTVMNSPGRHMSRAIINTSLAMAQLSKVPSNRSVIQSLPTEKVFTLEWTDQGVPDPGADNVLGTSDDSATPLDAFYPAGVRVKHGGNIYTSATSHTPSNANQPPDTVWALGADNAPLLLDGWGNPIIYVPPAGLRVRVLGDKSSNDPNDAGQTYDVVSPDGQSFWASAGPDGIYWTGDDNLYSFDN